MGDVLLYISVVVFILVIAVTWCGLALIAWYSSKSWTGQIRDVVRETHRGEEWTFFEVHVSRQLFIPNGTTCYVSVRGSRPELLEGEFIRFWRSMEFVKIETEPHFEEQEDGVVISNPTRRKYYRLSKYKVELYLNDIEEVFAD